MKIEEKGFSFRAQKVKIVLRFHFFPKTLSRARKVFSPQQKSADKNSIRKGIYFRCRGRSRRKHFPKKTSNILENDISVRDYGNFSSFAFFFAMEASHFECFGWKKRESRVGTL
jgi:hypothetical protein